MRLKLQQKGFIQLIPLLLILVSIGVASAGTGIVLHQQGKLTPLVASISEALFVSQDSITKKTSEVVVSEEVQSVEEELSQGQREASQANQELEEAKLQAEKIKAEAERFRREAEDAQRLLKEQREQEALRKQQETQRLAEEQRIQEQERQRRRLLQESLGTQLSKLFNELIISRVTSDLASYQVLTLEIEALYQYKKDAVDSGINACNELYDSRIEWVREETERRKVATLAATRGLGPISMKAISDRIEGEGERDIEELEYARSACLAKYFIDTSVPALLSQVRSSISSLQGLNADSISSLVSGVKSVESQLSSALFLLGGSKSYSVPSLDVRPSSFTCKDDVSGFSCRDSFGSFLIRCSETTAGYFSCTDSDFNLISCQENQALGQVRCSF